MGIALWSVNEKITDPSTSDVLLLGSHVRKYYPGRYLLPSPLQRRLTEMALSKLGEA